MSRSRSRCRTHRTARLPCRSLPMPAHRRRLRPRVGAGSPLVSGLGGLRPDGRGLAARLYLIVPINKAQLAETAFRRPRDTLGARDHAHKARRRRDGPAAALQVPLSSRKGRRALKFRARRLGCARLGGRDPPAAGSSGAYIRRPGFGQPEAGAGASGARRRHSLAAHLKRPRRR